MPLDAMRVLELDVSETEATPVALRSRALVDAVASIGVDTRVWRTVRTEPAGVRWVVALVQCRWNEAAVRCKEV